MNRLLALIVIVAALCAPALASAQDKCEGPQELCAQVLQLKADLETQKKAAQDALAAKTTDERQVAALQAQRKDQEAKTVKFVGAMSTLAVVLKILLSLLTSWKDAIFKSDRGKASLRLVILGITLGIFLTTNMGFGIPWWQALILAAGGPLSMVLHEMMKLIPVVRGKAKLQDPPADPPQA